MLTCDDRTIANGPELLDRLAGTGLRHIGFKDVGADAPELRRIREAIRGLGATSYLETVTTGAEAVLESARAAVDLGVDCLLGGTRVEETLEIIEGSGIAYYPFPGSPAGHPTRLDGSAADIAADCRRFMALGCAGADLLAYRARVAEPLSLVRAAREALGDGRLIVAGSVSSQQQIAALGAAGADAFTIGTAILKGKGPADFGAVRERVVAVLAGRAASAGDFA